MIDNFSSFFEKARKTLKTLHEEATRNRKEDARLFEAERRLARESEHTNHSKTIDISTASVARAALAIVGILALGWFLLEIKNVIALFFIAAFLALALDPFVDWMQDRKIPRGIGTLLIYIIFLGVTGIVISSFVPILANEIPKLAKAVLDWVSGFGVDTTVIQNEISNFQNYLTNIQSNLSGENIKAGLGFLGSVGQNAFAVVKSVAGGVVNFVLVFVIAFFMIIDEDGIKNFLIALFPKRLHRYISEKGSAVQDKFGAWVRGELILMLALGTITFIALKIAGVNYAATLATLAALTELLPYVGPIIALSQGGWVLTAVVVVIYIAIQQIEGNVLVPLVMKKAVGLSPVIVMFAMFVGASFPETINPIVGIIIAVPIATAVSVFVHDYAEKKK